MKFIAGSFIKIVGLQHGTHTFRGVDVDYAVFENVVKGLV
jgi:hypothetical protein